MHIMFFSRKGLVLDHPVSIGRMVNGLYYCALVQDNMRPDLCYNQQEVLEHGVILFQDNATPHHHGGGQNLVQCWGWEV
jgi:hypothetical protein